MARKRQASAKSWIPLMAALVLTVASGCNSRTGSRDAQAVESADSDTTSAHIDVMCIGDRINNPHEPFHYSYKYADASSWVEKEADVTPQTLDITTKDKSGSHSYHGVRSDEASWNGAVLDLSGLNITAMSARLDSLNGGSAIVRQGSESMNGYHTTRYAIDTSSADSSDKQQFETLFGKGSFEKGTVWVPSDGCAVKLVLDEGIWQSNGNVKTAHYEMARIKK